MGHAERPPRVKSSDPLGREPSDETDQNRPSGVTLPHNKKRQKNTPLQDPPASASTPR
jgi:hypothetical protein